MWELDCKESWALKNWCFWTVVLEKTLESPLDSKEIQPVYPKGSQSWVFIGKTDAEAEAPLLWPPDAKNWLIGKDPDAGKDWRQEKKGMTEDEIVGWHHWRDGHEFEQAVGVGDGQGILVCPGCKELDMTEWLNLPRTIYSGTRCGGGRFLGPRGLQHIRLPCPSLSPGVCSNSCPLSQWCHPIISSSVISFSFCLQSFPASVLFKWVSSSHQVTKILELQLQHQSFQWIFRTDFL